MKIVYIVPGFGGTFYCQNCMRDHYLSDNLKLLGHEVITTPIYLPLKANHSDYTKDIPVFYGAINVYLKERFPFFRNIPKWFEKILNSRTLLNFAARRSGSTNVKGLGQMTISVLKGHDGNQSKELELLINWLKQNEKPDIVHISNALLLGLAGRIKKELGCRIFCTLQDEDTWIDAMEKKYAVEGWRIMSEKVKDVDAFVVVSKYYADFMKKRMNIPDKKLFVVPIGVKIPDCRINSRPFDPPVIGFLSRLSETLGLDILVDAFILIKHDDRFKNVKLCVTGGKVGEDNKFISKLKKKIRQHGYEDSAAFDPDLYKHDQCGFLQSLTILSVPVPHGEAFGTYLIEALSVGVPVIQPEVGAFPEIIKHTKGGMIYKPNTPEKLADTIKSLLSEPGKVERLGRRGRNVVLKEYNIKAMVKNLDKIYRRIV